MVITTLSASIPGLHPDDGAKGNALHWTTLLISLFLVAVGTGGIKPNVSTFGADQFETGDPQDEKEKGSFFNFFYFFINVGALIASLVLVNVQESQGWAIGFMIPGIASNLIEPEPVLEKDQGRSRLDGSVIFIACVGKV